MRKGLMIVVALCWSGSAVAQNFECSREGGDKRRLVFEGNDKLTMIAPSGARALCPAVSGATCSVESGVFFYKKVDDGELISFTPRTGILSIHDAFSGEDTEYHCAPAGRPGPAAPAPSNGGKKN